MARDESVGGGTLVLAFIAGAVTGAAVALLFAPATGDDTRQLLADKAREGRHRAGEAAKQGREFLNRQRDTLKSAVDRGREAYHQAREGEGSEETV
jgi:gas vesicle protein